MPVREELYWRTSVFKNPHHRISLLLIVMLIFCVAPLATAEPRQESATGITHSFLALGGETYIMGDDGKVLWSYPKNTRDGFVLPSGNVLLAVTACKEYPGGAAVEITREGKVV